ncbi:MAG: heavy metal translocating P-type ATPase metal-binding domain-containing protein, partial [Myxococcales bacterium]
MASGDDGPFCCSGCQAVYGLIKRSGLERYYDLRGATGTPVSDSGTSSRDRKWLEPLEAKLAEARGIARVDLDLQGIHCTACVWLLEELFRRRPG